MAVIMLVEDVLELRDLISNRLLALGHTVVTAESLIGAQEALLEHRFEFGCLILDLCFPRVDGDTADETMGAILRRWVRERCPELPIIVNTALGSDHTLAVETFRDGATDFIKKSLSSDPRESLVVAVDRALEIRARRRAASPAPGSSEARRYTDHRLLLLGDRSGRRLFAAALNERRFAFQRLHFTILWTLAQGLRSGGEGWIHSQALDT